MSSGDAEPAAESPGTLTRAGRKFVGFFDSVNKVVGSIAGILALAAALGLVTLAGGGDDGGEEDPEPEPVSFEASELAPVAVDRYAFTFQHPRTWEREDSFNSDGAVFHSPDEAVELRAYGALAHEGPTTVLDRVEYLGEEQKRSVLDAGGRVLSDDLRFVSFDVPDIQRTPAARVVYASRNPETGGSVASVVMLTTQQGRDVTISCQVARSRFREFRGACNQLVATLTLAPFGS